VLTSHRILQKFWHDDRYDLRLVRVWYTDRGAAHDMSAASGPDITLEPGFLNIRTTSGEKLIPYHRILLITYFGAVVFENRKVRGRGNLIAGNSRDICGCGDKESGG